ncbi:MAG: hypothetical protein ACRC1T_04790 [Clostridium chrysemydis]|uniref:hypothetical protein n=1 Tax=Clostridium chrysemydis TaxID=2665504 RepID=UPI003F3BCC07
MKKHIIIDDETGEIISEEVVNMKTNISKRKITLCKKMVDDMLEKASKGEELDKDMLYAWCKITKEFNGYGQVKLLGGYRDIEFEKRLVQDIIMTGYTMRVITLAHPFSGFLQRNRQSFIETWSQLYDEIGIGNSKATQSKVKKFLIDNHIVREFKIGGKDGKLVKRLILNPFLARKGSYTSQVTAMVFQDFIKEGTNMSCYPIRWLQAMGYIN